MGMIAKTGFRVSESKLNEYYLFIISQTLVS